VKHNLLSVVAVVVVLACSNTSPPPPATKSALTTPPLAASAAPGATGSALSIVPFASGFSNLTFVTNAGDGTGDMFAVAQVGRIYMVTKGQAAPGNPWLDISDRVSSGGERGLLGLAFNPDYASNGRFYVDYTDLDGNSVISEFTRATDGTVDPSSERVILHVDQPYANHNGGMLAFGTDGYLYIGFGDGGSEGDPQGRGQSLTTDLGKILRIDVGPSALGTYGIPANNPFTGAAANGQLPEIWDWGLRNPWRFSFDSQTGALFIGDVGQNQTEEIDVEQAGLGGRNYGWNIMEGDHCYNASTCDQTGLTLPVATYSHAQGCAVIGGYVYRGARYPALAGSFLYTDDCSGNLWSFDAAAANAGQPVTPAVVGKLPFSPSSFGEDEAGELYVVDGAGAIYTLSS
jgi:glucose/arabinose dehydrogenase